MLICNVLFRLGGAAVLLTNRSDPVVLQLCCRYRDAGQQISHHAQVTLQVICADLQCCSMPSLAGVRSPQHVHNDPACPPTPNPSPSAVFYCSICTYTKLLHSCPAGCLLTHIRSQGGSQHACRLEEPHSLEADCDTALTNSMVSGDCLANKIQSSHSHPFPFLTWGLQVAGRLARQVQALLHRAHPRGRGRRCVPVHQGGAGQAGVPGRCAAAHRVQSGPEGLQAQPGPSGPPCALLDRDGVPPGLLNPAGKAVCLLWLCTGHAARQAQLLSHSDSLTSVALVWAHVQASRSRQLKLVAMHLLAHVHASCSSLADDSRQHLVTVCPQTAPCLDKMHVLPCLSLRALHSASRTAEHA